MMPPYGVGEICIAGEGLAKGYINDEAKTNEKFVQHPFETGKLLYKTGDTGYLDEENVFHFVGRKDDQVKIIGSHDGYKKQFGLIHHRLLSLSHDGYSLSGEDWIECIAGHDVIQKGLGWPFAVHFHIHPDVEPTRSSDGLSVTLTLPDSQVWKLTANDAVIHLEESTFYADFAGPCQSIQAVIRGNCVGPISIPWKLTKVIETQTPDPSKVPTWLSKNVISLEEALEEQAGDKEKKEAQITDLVEDKEVEPPKSKKKKPGKPNVKSKKPHSKKRSGLASLPTFEPSRGTPPPLPKQDKETDNKRQEPAKKNPPKKPEADKD